MNPLLKDFSTPFHTAPFSKLKNEHFLPAFKQAISDAKSDIDYIVSNPEVPTFKNTVEALEFAGQQLERISAIFFNLNSAETNDEIQKIAQEVSPLLAEFSNDITLNENLFERIKTVYEQKDMFQLTVEQKTLLDKKYKSFSRNGANLPKSKKKKLREIDKELSKLKLQFGENVLAETNAYELHVTDEAQLKGLPESALEEAQHLAETKGKKGWIFTLQYPSYIPFMTYAENRELRKQLAIAFGAKGFQKNQYNNEEIVLKIAKLRHERANLLGYKTHAHYVLEERMAKNPETVNHFLHELLDKAKPAAHREFTNLQQFAKELDGIDTLEKWDGAYY